MTTTAPVQSNTPMTIPRERSTLSLLVLLCVIAAPSIGVLFAMVIAPGTIGTAVFIACKAAMLALPLIWFLWGERQRISLSPARHGGFLTGTVLGILISAVIGVGYMLVGTKLIDADHVRAMAVQNGIGTKTMYLLGAAYWITINSLLEEYVYRWFIFRQAERFVGPIAAVVVAAVAFTIHHVIALRVQFDWTITLIGSAGVFTGGLIWSWMYMKYRSIWPGYLSHAIVDIAVFAVGWKLIFG